MIAASNAEPARREIFQIGDRPFPDTVRRFVEKQKTRIQAGDRGGKIHLLRVGAIARRRRSSRAGKLAAGPTNSPRKNSMSAFRGHIRQEAGSIVRSRREAVCQPVKRRFVIELIIRVAAEYHDHRT